MHAGVCSDAPFRKHAVGIDIYALDLIQSSSYRYALDIIQRTRTLVAIKTPPCIVSCDQNAASRPSVSIACRYVYVFITNNSWLVSDQSSQQTSCI
jgi:hypothetical protein